MPVPSTSAPTPSSSPFSMPTALYVRAGPSGGSGQSGSISRAAASSWRPSSDGVAIGVLLLVSGGGGTYRHQRMARRSCSRDLHLSGPGGPPAVETALARGIRLYHAAASGHGPNSGAALRLALVRRGWI